MSWFRKPLAQEAPSMKELDRMEQAGLSVDHALTGVEAAVDRAKQMLVAQEYKA